MKPSSDGDTELAVAYGVIRRADSQGRDSWYVSIRRQGTQVRRSFHCSAWGGRKQALAVACAYRKEVTATLPPMTTHNVCTKLKRNNTSGVSGVYRQVPRRGSAYWVGHLSSKTNPQRRSFPIDTYGEEKAKELAIAFREAALAKREERFLTFDPVAEAITEQEFASLLEGKDRTAIHAPLMSEAEMAAKVAEIDARYDALVPSRLSVYARISPMLRDHIIVCVTGGTNRRRKKRMTSAAFRDNPFKVALERVRAHIKRSITELYDEPTACGFLADHAIALSPKGFDEDNGLQVVCLMPSPDQERELNRMLEEMPIALSAGDDLRAQVARNLTGLP